VLDRLHELAVDLFGDDLGRPTIISKPSRRIIFDQDGQLQFAAAQTLKLSGLPVSSTRMETLVSSSFSRRSRRLREVTYWPSRPASGELLTDNCMAMVGSSMTISGKRRGILDVGDGLADGDAFDAGDGDDVAGLGLLDVGALESAEAEELGDLGLLQRAVALGDGDFLAGSSVPLKTRAMARRPR
jgi:hypothetical protein